MPHGPPLSVRNFQLGPFQAVLQGPVEFQALQDMTTPPLPATLSRQI